MRVVWEWVLLGVVIVAAAVATAALHVAGVASDAIERKRPARARGLVGRMLRDVTGVD